MENTSRPHQKKRRSVRNLLIEPFKQVRFGLYMLAINIIFLCASGLILLRSFFEQYDHVLSIFHVVDPKMRWEFIADEVFYTNVTRLLICIFIFTLVFFATILKLTHSYYGPIVALNRYILELKNGNFSLRIKLRKGDELQGIANNLNELAETLEKRKKNGE